MAGKILIAQSRDAARPEIGACLAESGYELLRAESLQQASELLRSMPDLLLLDVALTSRSLPAAGEALVDTLRTAEIPCVLYSSSLVSQDTLEIIAPWAADFVPHPCDPEELRTKVATQMTILRLRRELELVQGKLVEKQMELEDCLKSAAYIQKTLVPARAPGVENLSFAWRFHPCARVGGDLFNFQRLDEETLGVYIFDVSGHGVASAMMTVSVFQSLSGQTAQLLKREREAPPHYEIVSPGKVLEELDRAYPYELFQMFFTICYLLVEPRTGRIRYSSGGHPPPVLVRSDGSVELLREGGTIIGMGGLVPFREGTAVMGPGDRLYLYTDGIIEHAIPGGEMFGEDRFFGRLSGLKGEGMEAVCDGVLDSLREFGQGFPVQDDVTLLGMEFG